MDASLPAVLNDAERLLVAQTEPAELAPPDGDAAIELEARIGAHVTSTSANTAAVPLRAWLSRTGVASPGRRTGARQ